MYRTILVPVDGTDADAVILTHIERLAAYTQAHVILVHVADGWAARYFGAEAKSAEVAEDRRYLEALRQRLEARGISVEAVLAFGDPGKEIVRLAEERGCDLIAMSTHGHRFISDLLYGSAADTVRHAVKIPILLLKAR